MVVDIYCKRDIIVKSAKIIKWARMKFKAEKSRSVSLTKGWVPSQPFTFDNEHILTLWQQKVKVLEVVMLCHWLTDVVERRYTKSCWRVSKLLKIQACLENSRCGAFRSATDSLAHAGIRQHYDQDLYSLSGKTSYRQISWSAAAEVPVKFQSDWKSLNPNLTASRHHEILR